VQSAPVEAVADGAPARHQLQHERQHLQAGAAHRSVTSMFLRNAMFEQARCEMLIGNGTGDTCNSAQLLGINLLCVRQEVLILCSPQSSA